MPQQSENAIAWDREDHKSNLGTRKENETVNHKLLIYVTFKMLYQVTLNKPVIDSNR